MSAVTDADREKAAEIVECSRHRGEKFLELRIAAALAAERDTALTPVLALADDYDDGSEWGMATHPGHAIRERIRAALAAALTPERTTP